MPTNLVTGMAAGVIVALVAIVAAPAQTQSFYAAAVQIVPVFLVAVALERSLAETLGSETTVIAEALERAEREWTPPSSETRAYYGVGLQLRELGPQSFSWNEITGSREETKGLSDVDLARTLPRAEALDPDAMRRLVVALGARVVGDRPRFGRRTRNVSRDELLAQWDILAGALTERAKQRAKDELEYQTTEVYRARRRLRRLSILASALTLATAELLAFIGLLSPGRPYVGLFSASAGAVAASFVAVTTDAVGRLFARDLDVQSAGLDWTGEPVGSHWDAL